MNALINILPNHIINEIKAIPMPIRQLCENLPRVMNIQLKNSNLGH